MTCARGIASDGEPERTEKRTSRLLSTGVLLLILAGVGAHASTVTWGFLYDDFFHQAYLRFGAVEIYRAPWDLYDFGSGRDPEFSARGMHPWWTSPDFRLHFFRPVASLTIWLDYQLFGGWAPGYHLTSLAFFAAFLVLVIVLFRSLGAPPSAACWGLALLAVNDTHVLPVGWIANRNTLLGSLFIVLTVWAVDRHRRRQSRGWLIVALVSFLLACGSRESGMIGWPLVGWYLLVIDRPAPSEPTWRGCIRVLRSGAFWMFGVAAAAYLALYLGMGQGSSNAPGLYLTPWEEPGTFAMQVAMRVPLALASLLFHMPTDLIYLYPHLLGPMFALSLPMLGLLAVLLWWRLRSNSLALFGAGWAVLAVLPLGAADLSDRHLMDASVGMALLLGIFMADIGPLRDLIQRRQHARLTAAALVIGVGIVSTIPAFAIRTAMFATMGNKDREAIATAEIEQGAGGRGWQTVLVITAPSVLLALEMYPAWVVLHNDREHRIAFLQLGRRSVEWRRETDETALVTFGSPPLLSDRYEKVLYGAKPSPPPGSTFAAGEFTVTVIESEPAGIRTVRLRFKRSLDDPSYRFLAWDNGKLRRVTLPPVGETRFFAAAAPIVPFAP